MAVNVEDLLVVAERVLGDAGAPHALIGGCARNVYAPPRATRDVDLAVLASDAQYVRIGADLRAAGFGRLTETRAVADAGVPDVALFSDDSGARIDLLLAHTPFERQAIANAVPTSFPAAGIVVPLVRVEDLLIYKVLAGRPRDLGDIEDIVRTQVNAGTAIDWGHIERECEAWGATDALRAIRRG